LSIRFLADEDVDANLLRGLQRREPAIDILDVRPPACGKLRIPNCSNSLPDRIAL
jgi:hypothetical protein